MHDEEDSRREAPSRSQIKREVEALQALGEALVRLPQAQLDQIVLPDALREAVAAARKITSRGAGRRQRQYIGRLMREVDAAPIRAALDRIRDTDGQATARQHRLEALREQLISQGDAALGTLLEQYPQADRQHLRRLAREAAQERAQGRPPTASRKLFRYLRELMEGV